MTATVDTLTVITKQTKELLNMDNLEEVMNAFARLMETNRNPLYALQELAEKLDKHGRKALREWDEMKAHEQELEGENAELRRRLLAAGINHRIGDAA